MTSAQNGRQISIAHAAPLKKFPSIWNHSDALLRSSLPKNNGFHTCHTKADKKRPFDRSVYPLILMDRNIKYYGSDRLSNCLIRRPEHLSSSLLMTP
jgi:hypothetical protein